MTAAEKIAKAERIAFKLVNKYGMAADFAKAMGLNMVRTGDYSVKRNRMPVFLAGPKGAEKFREAILNANA